MKNSGYRPDIDALRGVSVLLVIIFHAFPNMLPGGFIGVDVFFVISGYLITTIIIKELDRGEFSFFDFYQRRILRILPALLTVLLFSMLLGWLILFPKEFENLGHHIFSSIIFIQNFTLIKEFGYFDTSSHFKPLLHLWTLSVEEQYYLIWPVIIFIIIKWQMNILKVIASIIVLSFMANLYFVGNYKDVVFFHSLTRFWELGIGSVLGIYFFSQQKKNPVIMQSYPALFFAIGLGLILGTAFFINSNTLYPYWYGIMPVLGASLIISANLKLKNWGGLVAVGLISYPLYLWHWVVISFSYIYLGQKPSNMILLALIALSFILSYFTYRYIEKIRYHKTNKTTLTLLSLFLLVGVMGISIRHYDGMPNRKHVAYLAKYDLFKTIPARDKKCSAHVASLSKDKIRLDYCRSSFSEKNDKTLALIGDSHAHVMFPGIAKEANKHGYNTILLANKACPLLLGFYPVSIETCKPREIKILEVLAKDNKIEKVIFVARGPRYIHGDVKGRMTDISVRRSLAKGTKLYKNYADGFEKTLRYLSNLRHVQNIFYYLENPELDYSPRISFPRPFDVWGISENNILPHSVMPQKYYTRRMKKYKNIVLKKAKLFSKVSIIDVAPYFCEGGVCYSYKDGKFLYSDDDHLSEFGSHYLADKTEHILFR